MKPLTNRFGYPQAVINCVEYEPYSRGESQISVTQLIKSPQIVALENKYFDEIEQDVDDLIFALFGQVAHIALERSISEGDISERRLFTTINDWVISGQFDILTADGILRDYKMTSVYAVKSAKEQQKTEWDEQLNLLRALIFLSDDSQWPEGKPDLPHKVEIMALCRDWRRGENLRQQDYPKKIECFNVKLWPIEKSIAYLKARVKLHQIAANGTYGPCTPEEQWYTGDSYAVMKKGNKKATRLFSGDKAKEYATKMIEAHKDKKLLSLEFRPGVYNRCRDYCSVSPFCKQWIDINKGVLPDSPNRSK